MTQPNKERDHVRELARRVAAVAAEPRQQDLRRRWRDVNALRRPDRAPVWCKPVAAWGELLPEESLLCTDPWLRSVERMLRRILIKREIGDDDPIAPAFPVSACFDCKPANLWGVDIRHHHSTEKGGSWAFDPPLKSIDDFDKLRAPVFTRNKATTNRALEAAEGLLGDILPVRLTCGPVLHSILCNYAVDLRGLTQMMMDVALEPELVHRLMAYLRDAVIAANRAVEATGLLSPNTDDPMTCSEPIGEPAPDGRLTLKDLWIMTNSQEFDQVSPPMWEEFLLNYQKPILEQFGLSSYGCCENLTNKIDGVLSIPNLRIFVCSAWTDLDKVIDRVGDRHVIMWRQKATDVVYAHDAAALGRDLEEGARRLQGCRYQVVLRELQTLAGHPDRLHAWTQLALDAAAKYA